MEEKRKNKLSRKKSFIVNLFILSFGTILPKLTTFITLPIITGGLSKAEYGTYDLITTLVSFLLPVVTLQLHSAAFRFLIECRNDREKEDKIISNTFIFVCLSTLLSELILFFALYKFDFQIRSLICIFYGIEILFRCVQYIVRGMNLNKVYSASCVMESILNMILVIAFLKVGKSGLPGLLVSMIASQLLAILFVILKVGLVSRIKISYSSKSLLREMLAYSMPMIPNVISIWVLSSSDRIVLTAVWGTAVNAIYAAANKIPLILNTIQTAFTQAWQENASISVNDSNLDEYYSEMFDDVVTVTSGLLAALIMALPLLFHFLIKGDYEEAYPHIGILFMGAYFSCIMSFLGGIYVAHKETKSIGITTLVSAGINLGIDLIGVNYLKIYAASLSTFVAYMVIAIYRMIDVRRFQPMKYNIKKLVAMIVILNVMCVISGFHNIYTSIANLIIGLLFMIIFEKSVVIKIINIVKEKKKNEH